MNIYEHQLEVIRNTFGTPSNPAEGKIYSKIKKAGNFKYYPMAKLSFFGKWKYLERAFYDEQPGKGYTKMRARLTTYKSSTTSLESAYELIEDFETFRGAGITIW